MMISARIDPGASQGPNPWDATSPPKLPLDHIICWDLEGTPHTIREFVWPWSAYTKDQRSCNLHFYYWREKEGRATQKGVEVSLDREARIRELQFLMSLQLYYGDGNAPKTLQSKLYALHYLGRFSESRSCTVLEVLTNTILLDACGESMPDAWLISWKSWLGLLSQLDPVKQLGFTLAPQKGWRDLCRRTTERYNNARQFAPLPTRVYGRLINNLSTELDDIDAHAPMLLAALREALAEHSQVKSGRRAKDLGIGPALIEKYGLADYLVQRGFSTARAMYALSGAVTEIFLVCRWQIQVFSGMRRDEAQTLPYHCMVTKKGRHGRTNSLIAGITTKFNKGRRLRTHWVTTDREGFRAIRLAQQFAAVIYESLDLVPSKAEAHKDEFPLFPSTAYLPWGARKERSEKWIQASRKDLSRAQELCLRLLPSIEEEDIAELEEIDPNRAWRDEKEFTIGQCWQLKTHQFRRSLALYANASGLVRLSSLRRQLQHISREMSLYYGRGSTFCKNFIASDPEGYKRHVAPEWQEGEEEAEMLSFTRDVLNSKEPMFGGAGNFYQRQKERGEVMSREEVVRRMKAGLLNYQPGPLGGCVKPGGCDKRKGLALIDISCATNGCKNLVGKHSKVIRVIQLKRAAVANMAQDSIEARIEREELEALERVEREWRSQSTPPTESLPV